MISYSTPFFFFLFYFLSLGGASRYLRVRFVLGLGRSPGVNIFIVVGDFVGAF